MKNRLIKSSASILAVSLGFISMNLSAAGVDLSDAVASNNAPLSVKDSIVADFDELVKIIEDTHPDPYMSFGGRVFFHKRSNDFRRQLMNDSNVNVTDLYHKASEFISQMQDGHSFVNSTQNMNNASGSDSLLVVKFMCGDGALIVNGIDSTRTDLIGSRLIGINGKDMNYILDRVGACYPCENKFGRMGKLCNWFLPVTFYRNVLGDSNADITMEFLTPNGERVAYIPEKVQYNQFGEIAKARVPKDERFPSEQMEWKEVDGSMFFRLASVMARENFEFQYENGWDFYNQLAYQYRTMGKEIPADTLAAIKALPSMSETFLEMLQEMKAKDLKNLVIDLRGNSGGWTPIVLPTLYMMFGDRYLETDMDAKFYRRISDLYLKKSNTDIATFNANNGTHLKIGDYLMPEEEVTDTRTMEEKRQYFLQSAFCSDSIRQMLIDRDGEPIYTPEKIYVVTDEGTFSAAFHYAFYLSKLGAIIAGETSSQAPNCYMEVTPFTLPLTGLSGSISNSMQIFLSGDDPRSKEFTPDVILTYDDYRTYGFDTNSILIHLLNLLSY